VDGVTLLLALTSGDGHLRVILKDAPLSATATNLSLVEDTVRMVREHRGEPATVAEVRQALANG
jgi:uncharacterized protein (DUF849 family)